MEIPAAVAGATPETPAAVEEEAAANSFPESPASTSSDASTSQAATPPMNPRHDSNIPQGLPLADGSLPKPYYFDDDGFLRHYQTDTTVDTDSAIKGDLGPQILEFINEEVQEKMVSCGMMRDYIPNAKVEEKCEVFVSQNWQTCSKLLVLVQDNKRNQPGIWSRGLCISHGLNVGSMLPYIAEATKVGFGIIIPNSRNGGQKLKIDGSATPLEHMLTIWDKYIIPSAAASGAQDQDDGGVCFLSYDEGSSLVRGVLGAREHDITRTGGKVKVAVKGITFIEPTKYYDKAVPAVEALLEGVGIQLERQMSTPSAESEEAEGVEVAGYSLSSVGSSAITCTLPARPVGADEAHTTNMAMSVSNTMPHVCAFLSSVAPPSSATAIDSSSSSSSTRRAAPAEQFVRSEAKRHSAQCLPVGSTGSQSAAAAAAKQAERNHRKKHSTTGLGIRAFFRGLVGSGGSDSGKGGKSPGTEEDSKPPPVTVDDFELLQVVGKGAFGKVFLVKKKEKKSNRQEAKKEAKKIYAMKVLLKQHIFNKNQVEHTAAERRILQGIDHPYLVQLRFAFQTSKKLYMIMDYYAGGSLFFHLRKAKRFSLEQARFYSAELALAMTYLHSLDIVYRDMKLENILMDKNGHVHLTDFGLSKEGVAQANTGAKTFCGTAEYVAPELLAHKSYGKAADWWSFGILTFEMVVGRTPFYSKNRQQMFKAIVHSDVKFPDYFHPDAADLVRRMCQKDPHQRFGISGKMEEFYAHPFFKSINKSKLESKQLKPPYTPNIKSDTDTTYVHRVFLKEAPVDNKPTDDPDTVEGADGYDKDKHFDDFDYRGEGTFQ